MFLELETRDCEPSDFNDVEGSNSDTNFYPTSELAESDILTY